MAAKTKTWAVLDSELSESMRKWDVATWYIEAALKGRYSTRLRQSLEERAVTLKFRKWKGLEFRWVTLTMRAGERSIDNLEALVKAVEHLRMGEYRGITKLLVFAYRQLDPATPAAVPPPPGSPPPAIPAHYQRLGILPDAPLEVAEAAYKALARRAHPDAGGSTVRMQQLNAAIEIIRKEKVR